MRAPGLRLSAAMGLAASALAFASPSAATRPSATSAQDTASAWSESGQASWYGPRHEGMRTTSGERFDSNRMTAAHPTLPLGSYVRVTLQSSGQSIIVRVNDREPPHGVRCIDLSHAAAAKLGIVRSGVADVTLAQVGPDEAQGLAEELAEAPADATPVEASSGRHVTAPHGRRHTRRAHR